MNRRLKWIFGVSSAPESNKFILSVHHSKEDSGAFQWKIHRLFHLSKYQCWWWLWKWPITWYKMLWDRVSSRVPGLLVTAVSTIKVTVLEAGLSRMARPCTRTVSFEVVLERARPKIKFGTERPGTRNDQILKKYGNEVVPGTRSFLVVPRARAQHRNGILRVRTTLCQNEI